MKLFSDPIVYFMRDCIKYEGRDIGIRRKRPREHGPGRVAKRNADANRHRSNRAAVH